MRRLYRRGMRALGRAGVPFLVGGTYAFERYTGIARQTKDLDIFLRRTDLERALAVFEQLGCRTELSFGHWLAKAYWDEHFIDLIYSSGNGVAEVDEEWFEHALPETVLGVPVLLCPAEEMIWQRAFIMERERFDGADVAHLLRACAEQLDWPRLLRRFDQHWRVLLSHLVLFGFIYPGERARLPELVMRRLLQRLQAELGQPASERGLIQGTLLSRAQYLVDLERFGYHDARLEPRGNMSAQDADRWTEAIDGG